MDPMKLSRSVAKAMADDVRDARWKVLRKLTPLEALFLLNLKDDLEVVSDMSWHDSLARRMKSRPEAWVENMELGDEKGFEFVEDMAEDIEETKEMLRELIREPVTIERLQKGQDVLRSKGIDVNLLNRLQTEEEQVSLN
jgi:hypothetical protein